MTHTDLQQVLSEAEKARQEAEAASRRAADLEAQAEARREQLRVEREARRRAWAQGIVDSYEADLTAADAASLAAEQRFNAVVVDDLPGAVAAYLEWGEAAVRHYTLQVRVGTAAPTVGMDASPAEAVMPPPFSRAVDLALSARIGEISDRARDDTAAEIARMLDQE